LVNLYILNIFCDCWQNQIAREEIVEIFLQL
jgi:hypothetical protein